MNPSPKLKTIRLRRILVPIDFSPASLETLRIAKLLAARFGAKLHLVHVIAPAPIYSLARGVLLLPFPDKAMVQSAKKRLQDLVSQFSLPPRSTQCIVRVGEAFAQINEAAEKYRADLIVIATRGLTGLKQTFLGSTTQRVVRSAPCPVLVVRGNEHFSAKERARRGRTPLQFQKILVPVDFSECSRVGLDYALEFAREFRSSLLLFHSVVVHNYALSDEYTALEAPNILSQQQEDADEEMTRLRREISKEFGKIETKVAVGSPVEGIDECVWAEGIDLIITSTHGRSGVKRVFIGSTAEQIVRHAPCPVLVVPNRIASKRPVSRK